jgi:hypothetical protein
MGFIAGGALAAAGSVAGSMMSANAAGKAADAQAQSASDQLALQKYMFEQGRTDQAPWRTVGGRSLNELAALYGIQPYGPGDEGYPTQKTGGGNTNAPTGQTYSPGGSVDAMGNYIGANPLPGSVPTGDEYLRRQAAIGADGQGGTIQPGLNNQQGGGNTNEKAKPWNREKAQAEAMSHFFTSPQYEWNLQQGMQGIDRSAAARGLLLSGAQMKAANKFASGLASGEWAGYTGQLANMAGLGQVSANQGAALGAQYSQQGSNSLQYMGNARGSGYINQANAMNSGLGNLSYLANRYGSGYGSGGYSGSGGYDPNWSSNFQNQYQNYQNAPDFPPSYQPNYMPPG